MNLKRSFLKTIAFCCFITAGSYSNAQEAKLSKIIEADITMSAVYATYPQQDITEEFSKHLKNAQALRAFRVSHHSNPVENIVVTDTEVTSIIGKVDFEHAMYVDSKLNKTVKTGEILTLAVKNDMRKNGIGSALLKYTIGYAQQSGCESIALTADPFDYGALSQRAALEKLEKFYEAHGFEFVSMDDQTTNYCLWLQ
jgi:N-acetylglutamate synthase-like GNAT family acetyltransferase